MLQLTHEQFEQIVAQGRAGKPLEICGLLGGRRANGSTLVQSVQPVESDDKSALTYSMNAADYMRASRAIEDAGLEIVGIYHTHPATRPYPSKTDVARAHWGETDDLLFPDYSYLIVSLRDPDRPEPRSFQIKGWRIPEDIAEEPVVVG
jgi:proteasome lid subunit RPN8/RPN11